LFCLAATVSPAQVDNNANAWYMYFGDHAFGKSRWGAHLEGQWRRTDLGLKWQQLLLRPAVNYQLHPKVMLTAGYAFVDTHRYGDYPARERFPEHRLYQQAQINQRWKGIDWQNRFRLEQRFIRGFAQRYENRVRYMLRANIPIAKSKFYLGAYNEIFYNWGQDVAFNVFDQNRAYVALGRQMKKQTRWEIGFLEQTIQQRNGRVFEHNHTLQVAIFSRLPFGE
jgi:hypothetical protein